MENTTFYIDNAQIKLFCHQIGAGDPLLLIHGACVDSSFFTETASYLARNYSVISYDRRGYGQSGGNPDSVSIDYNIQNQLSDAIAIIEQLNAPCHVIAHSAGSVIAMELALARPDLVRTLLLYEPPFMSGLHCEELYAGQLQKIEECIHENRLTRASCLLLSLLGPQDQRGKQTTAEGLLYFEQNTNTFLLHEFQHFMHYRPAYAALENKIHYIGVGEYSQKPFHLELAQKLHAKIICFPGMHNCPRELPLEFASLVTGLLKVAT